jgi:hypothetical protein
MKTFARLICPAFALFAGLAMVCAFTATEPAGAATHVLCAGSPYPTGLPAYEMRSDGLMINGLLPANGWEG